VLPGFPLTPKWTLLHPKNRSKTSKLVSKIFVSKPNAYRPTLKILGQDVTIGPYVLFFGL